MSATHQSASHHFPCAARLRAQDSDEAADAAGGGSSAPSKAQAKQQAAQAAKSLRSMLAAQMVYKPSVKRERPAAWTLNLRKQGYRCVCLQHLLLVSDCPCAHKPGKARHTPTPHAQTAPRACRPSCQGSRWRRCRRCWARTCWQTPPTAPSSWRSWWVPWDEDGRRPLAIC